MTPADIQHVIDQPGGYRLSEGMYATRAGVRLDDRMVEVIAAWFQIDTGEAFDLCYQWVGEDGATYVSNLWPWPDAAKRLVSKRGRPSIALDDTEYGYEWRISARGMLSFSMCEVARLARIALALIERETDAEEYEAFLVLHWCITELGV